MNSSRSARALSLGSLTLVLGTAAITLAMASIAPPQKRTQLPPGGSNWVRQNSLVQGIITMDMATGGVTPAGLVQALVGTGVSTSNIQFNGAPVAAGTFSGGTGIVGFAQGVVLSSGNIGSVVGPANLAPDTSTDNLMPGDVDLDALVTGLTQDACVLEFDFECPTTSVVSFQFVFMSEEYDEYVNTQYNDVFAFLLNGQNIALVPGTQPPIPVAINNVNCDNPYNPPAGANCALYVTNACDSLGGTYPCTGPLATEMDGKTVVFSASGTLRTGPNHIKLAIADRGDGVYDSNVFIRGESFLCQNPMPGFEPPSPCGQTLVATVGVPFHFDVDAIATNGLPNQTVVLTVSGDPVPLAGGVFTPPLPVGPAAEVETEFDWTPLPGDVGPYQLQFRASDQLGQDSDCFVNIDVRPAPGATFCYGDGTGTPCPCNNTGALGHGCANSAQGDGALLLATGVASVSNDTLVLLATGMPNGMCLYVQSLQQDNGGLGTMLGDGVRCINGSIIRLGVQANALGGSQYPALGNQPLSLRGQVPAIGGTRYYQCWYRNPEPTYCTGSMYNLTNGYALTWTP
jgi:hypothetical protein